MFYLHHSNRTENLIAQLAEVLRLEGRHDPFASEYFLIQSQGMERMLSQRLCDVFGSWCNYEYMLPTRFFALLAERLEIAAGSEDYGRERLCWHLEKILRSLNGEVFESLNRYVAGDSSGLKRFQLAQQLAHIFDQYQIMRPAMIARWQKGQLSTTNPAEGYQLQLWNMLVTAIGHGRHRGVFLRDLMEMLGRDSISEDLLPRRLSVFGIHSMPPIFLSCLQALAVHCDVHLFLLSPCAGFWGDQPGRRAQLKEALQPAGHPLLVSLSQQGREFQDMLTAGVNFAGEYSSFEDPLDQKRPCLLHRLQSDLLKGELSPMPVPLTKDGSLLLSSAHSPHREMMVLRDHILAWLDEDFDLELKDIVVMAPDIQDYSGLVSAIFHDIPHSVADKNASLSNPFLAIFLQFMRLVSSRFSWAEVLDLLEREEVYTRFDIGADELPLLRHWIIDSGVRWGLSGSQRRDLGVPERTESTWESGLARLFMGYACGREGEVCGVLPYVEIEGSVAAPLGGLSSFCELLERAYLQCSRGHSLVDWAELLAGFAEMLFGEVDHDGLVELHKLFSELGGEVPQAHGEEVSYEVIRLWLEGAAEEKRSSAGFLRGQLTFCSMLPMRSIPFAKVCILGLNDGVFPKNDFHPPFDLLGESFVPGDRSRRGDDRYQFLEAILSARSSLYLSYVGQSIRSNDSLPPSLLVSELVELVQHYGVRDLVDVHPLHGFSLEYFKGEGRLFSYDRQMLKVGIALGEDAGEPTPWWQGAVAKKKDICVTVQELLAFFRDPQTWFVRQVLGISFGFKEASVEESEVFELDRLAGYGVEQDLVGAGLDAVPSEMVLRQMQAAARWPLGTPGSLGFMAKEDELRPFVGALKELLQQGRRVDRFIQENFAGLHVSGKLGSLYGDTIILYRYATLKGKDILGAWLQHCLCAVCLGEARETTLLGRDYELIFPAGCCGRKDLEELLTLFLEGQEVPASLCVESAYAYALQAEKTDASGRGDPVAKAKRSLEEYLQKYGNGEWELLYRGRDPEELFSEEWLRQCCWFYESIWKRAHVREL